MEEKIKVIKSESVKIIKSKHNNPNIVKKFLVLISSIILLLLSYPFIKDSNLSPLLNLLKTNFILLALILIIWFLILFFKDNWIKILYYLTEFLWFMFVIYGAIIIKDIFSLGMVDGFRGFSLILVFVVSAILFDFKEILKSVYEDKKEDFMRVGSAKTN